MQARQTECTHNVHADLLADGLDALVEPIPLLTRGLRLTLVPGVAPSDAGAHGALAAAHVGRLGALHLVVCAALALALIEALGVGAAAGALGVLGVGAGGGGGASEGVRNGDRMRL